jgi:glycosyltransferase involved in cell wall biosynthesis
MRVGIYVGSDQPEAGGGYTFEQDVLEGVVAAGASTPHRFSVLCAPAAVSALGEGLAGTGIDVHPVAYRLVDRALARVLRYSAFARCNWRGTSPLDRVARATGIELLWFLGGSVHLTDLPYLAVVWDLHHRITPWFPEVSARGVWDGRELAHGWFLRRASGVITGTRAGREELERFYQLSPDLVHVVPYPTPRFALDAASPEVGTARRLGIRGKYLLYPAQFWPHKNHANLLKALALLRAQHGVSLELALVGADKGNRAHTELLARELDIAEAVHFLGFVSRPDLVGLYREAVALTYVSWFGPDNLPPLEAFALGCPVIASRLSGTAEQLGSAALLIDAGSPKEIAQAVTSLVDDDGLRARLVAAGRERARRWTATDYVRGVFTILDRFESIVSCWRPPRASS